MKKLLGLLLLTIGVAGAQQQTITYQTQPSGTVVPDPLAIPKSNTMFGQLYGMFGSGAHLKSSGSATAADLIGLFLGTCSSSTYLRGDGTCNTPSGSGGSSGPAIGSYLAYASATGTVNNVSPSGFGNLVGRLDVTLPSGAATWTGIAGGTDAQIIILRNADATSTLTLAVQSASSSAINRFAGPSGTLSIPPGAAVMLIYYAGTVNNWILL